MTARFPDLLPLPLVEDYSITPNEAIIRTQMESGTARQRRRFDSVPSKITVKWFMNASQFSLFEAWYKYHAKEGAEWFVISLLGGLGLIEQEARFTQQFTARLQNGIYGRLPRNLKSASGLPYQRGLWISCFLMILRNCRNLLIGCTSMSTLPARKQ